MIQAGGRIGDPKPDITGMLAEIASNRRYDPLAPVTVIVPSHVAALQLRRRLAEATAFAGVRFETLPRLAELIGAGHLAAEGRSPLARPIGDYLAGVVARGSGGSFERVRDLPGYARALRQSFRRLRRGGVRNGADAPAAGGTLADVLRAFDRFRAESSQFYDEEDLMETAAETVRSGRAGILTDLGAIYLVPPGPQSAAGSSLMEALSERLPLVLVEDDSRQPPARMVMAPDPASEAREVVREVLGALERGAGVHEVAVFHGAGQGYPRLLREAFDAAGVPAVSLPGIPLSESVMGRAVLMLLNLPNDQWSRTRTMDFFALAPLKQWIPAGDGRGRANAAAWDLVSRAAGITRGLEKWTVGLVTHRRVVETELAFDRRVQESDGLRKRKEWERDLTTELAVVIDSLAARLKPLESEQPAREFIAAFKSVLSDYFQTEAEGYEDVLREIDQLGTVDAVSGTFDLPSFHEALRANLEAGVLKEGRVRLGDGVLIADYRMAAGLRFRHVVLCGAYEAALPAGPGAEALLDDATWSRLRTTHPYMEDAALRIERNREAALRAARCATESVAWLCPLYEPGATRDFYPSTMMVDVAKELDPEVQTATRLRKLRAQPWLRRSSSPISTMVQGKATDVAELTLRGATSLRKSGGVPDAGHPQKRAVEMLQARRSSAFTEWDGNLASLSPAEWLRVPVKIGPTTLEAYGSCGFKYFARSILRLSAVEEPEEREMMAAVDRGTLVHKVLESFFKTTHEAGRPQPGEKWTDSDRDFMHTLLRDELKKARERGLTGREIFGDHEERLLQADLMRFLDEDDAFRAETGARPWRFEADLPPNEVAGIQFWGKVDRVDRSTDGKKVWVIDYKTGKSDDFDEIKKSPLARGSKLQLPVYLAVAGDADERHAMYWFITHKGEFKKIEFEPSGENFDLFERTVAAIVDGVAAGAFPAVSGDVDEYYGGWTNCRYCDFNRLCSRRREYEFEAKSSDPEIAGWLQVGIAAAPTVTDESNGD